MYFGESLFKCEMCECEIGKRHIYGKRKFITIKQSSTLICI